ncbi:hypothetical protein [Paraburkholderia dinghuensis]|nr:hypothetical protein [Paraburkholderia dinghuensis]
MEILKWAVTASALIGLVIGIQLFNSTAVVASVTAFSRFAHSGWLHWVST